ncbi:hypothetical protein HPB50_026782 [Hyalomma asiaticum]|uniref:Uncharacterized protein n=1 Tax=Hyalomma asiaticum TaxID=266040 RepID=A0ACB7SRI7_HYAAI|nr:hypothetical protein HPB50_026782 [Hyalomma asiaticum]
MAQAEANKVLDERVAERQATRERLELEQKAFELRLRIVEAGGSAESTTPVRETEGEVPNHPDEPVN